MFCDRPPPSAAVQQTVPPSGNMVLGEDEEKDGSIGLLPSRRFSVSLSCPRGHSLVESAAPRDGTRCDVSLEVLFYDSVMDLDTAV